MNKKDIFELVGFAAFMAFVGYPIVFDYYYIIELIGIK